MISDKEEPYISVIITAHNRKEFLKDAINSVLNQTLEKSFYEIIVIKNFEDQEIDNLIEENKIISLKVRDDSLIGEDLALGIERAKGEVISFLDDDDLFMPKKLETVYNYFKKYENLVYLHNSEYFIDEKG
ncbi:MAG: glycosyltransferase family 2 protein, partial [bacterium]